MLARVKQDYAAGPVMAFSGREYIRSEWREVPAGFDDEAKSHPLLETQPSVDEIRAESSMMPGLGNPAPASDAQESQPEPQSADPVAEETQAEPAAASEPDAEESQPIEPSTEPSTEEPPAAQRKSRTKK